MAALFKIYRKLWPSKNARAPNPQFAMFSHRANARSCNPVGSPKTGSTTAPKSAATVIPITATASLFFILLFERLVIATMVTERRLKNG